MTFKRIIIIILVLLLIAGALFGISWYVAKRKAVQSGTTPLTFKEFIGIGTPRYPGTIPDEGLTGEFTGVIRHDQNGNGTNDWMEDRDGNDILDGNEDKNNNGQLDGDEDQDGDGINNRDENVNADENGGGVDRIPNDGGGDDPFGPGSNNGGGDGGTNDPWGPGGDGGTDPWGPGGVDGPGGNGGGPDDGDGDGSGDGDGGGPDGPGVVIVDVDVDPDDDFFDTTEALACSAEDTNIEFTPSEIARLTQLQALFDNISETLYDDAAAEEQRALYTTFKIKTAQTKDLITFCENKSAQLPSQMRIRVPTPLYNGGANANTFTNNPIALSEYNSSSIGLRPIFDHPITAATFVERLLRINIW